MSERLPGLTHIGLDDIAAITSIAVETLASKCRELRFFVLRGCPNVSDVTLTKIAEHCSKLEMLFVNGCPDVTGAGLSVIGAKCSKLEIVNVDDRPYTLAVSLRRLFPRVTWDLV